MSEYQYYAFLAVDKPLAEADRQALRAMSTRARITATQFVNSYQWGGFKGDPAELMRRWCLRFDALVERGENAWRDVEAEISLRHASAYAKAVTLLSDLKGVAAERGRMAEFDKRLVAIRRRHARKGRFIERLAAGGL